MSGHAIPRHWLTILALTAGLTLGFAPPATPAAGERPPLLMEGKKSLFQRVLTRPGATPRPAPGATATARPLPPLSVCFVYARQEHAGEGWLELGSSSRGPTLGWVRERETTPWKQTLTLAFTNPAGRERVLFFQEKEPLRQLLEAPDRVARANTLRQAIAAPPLPEPFPVIAMEPPTHVDLSQKFYLLPILQVEESYLADGFPVRLARVASLTLEEGAAGPGELKFRANQPPREELLKDFRAAVVFVIDTTTSMGPYIERTREAVRAVHLRIAAANLGEKVRFGLVAYRSSILKTPGLQYVTRVYADPNDTADARSFLEKVRTLEPAGVSSHAFDEDAYAGLEVAINEIDWSPFQGRFLVLISDAGALGGNDPGGQTGLGAPQLRRMVLDRGMAVYALHLLTPAGAANHAFARSQYQELTTHPNARHPLYFPVEAGDVERFGSAMDGLAGAITNQVQEAATGKLAAPAAGKGAPGAAPGSPRTAIEAATAQVGLAMQLAYLGSRQGAAAPPLLHSWAADRDLAHPLTTAMEVRVLLTKNQLSDLQQVLKSVVEAGKRAQLAPQSFFDQLRSAAATMSRNPERLGKGEATRLAQLGLMGEYLDDLPYQSKVMSIDQALWSSWSIGEQQAFIDEIEAKIRLYQRYHDDVERWVPLDGGASPGEALYPVPLEALP